MQEAKLVLQRSTSLAKWTRVLRPADLEFLGRPVSILVSGEMVEVKLQAIFKKGLLLWFPGEGQYVPALTGLSLGPAIYCKNTGQQAMYEEVAHKGLVIDLKSALERSKKTGRKWRRGELIELELKAPCDPLTLLNFPAGLEGEKQITDDQVITRFRIRKRPESQDVIIRNYRWKRNLDGLLPVRDLKVIKNGTEQGNTVVDVVRTESTSASVDSLTILDSSRVETSEPHPVCSNQFEVSFSLSFEQPDDEYEIIFISERQ